MEDYYQILGIERSASEADIKSAYRKLAMKHHPDRGGDTAQFQKITEAYNTLSDADKKRQYDNPASQGFNFHFNDSPFQDGVPPGMQDMFDHIFGRKPGRPQNQNVRVRITVSLLESILGCDKYITLSYSRGGSQEIAVTVPPGIQPGSTIKYSGLGDNMIEKAPRGDLFVVVAIARHPDFDLDGSNLITNRTISVFEAMVGTKLQVSCVDGHVIEVTVPPGVQPNSKLRCANHGGWDDERRRRGDLIINLDVTVPKNLTEEQKSIIKQWIQ